MLNTGPPSPNAIELDFTVLHEGWNEYRIKDSGHTVTLKVRFVLQRIFLEGQDDKGNPNLRIGSNIVFTVKAPRELKGTSSQQKYTPEEVRKLIVTDDLPFEIVKEEWNDYQIQDITSFSIKPIVTTVSRSSLFDEVGDPIYYVQHQEIVKAKPATQAVENIRKLMNQTS